MKTKEKAGVFQLENGNWGFRYAIVVDGEKRTKKKIKDDGGRPFKTEKQAIRARSKAIALEQMNVKVKKPVRKMTFAEVYYEYCETGRKGKAYATIRKQDSLWCNHIRERFGKKYVDEITVVGSRCGQFAPILRLLEDKKINVKPLVEKVYDVEDFVEAFEDNSKKGTLKVLVKF